MIDEVKVTGFLGVFEDKLNKLINKIKAEYDKPKSERNKDNLKSLAKEAKKLRKLVNKMKEESAQECTCPKCGHEFKIL